MKLKPNINISAFLKAVQSCRADVHFTTVEGDALNLKSTLSQFVFAAVCIEELRGLKGSVQIEDPRDEKLLAAFLTPANETA